MPTPTRKTIATVFFDKSETKKWSVCYKPNTGEIDPAMTSIYVMKSRLPQPYPKKLWVTIEVSVGKEDKADG